MSLPIYVLNGPNLNLLGTREPEIYGRQTLSDIEQAVGAHAARSGLTVDFRQSNHEGVLIDWIQEARTKASAIVFNPGGYSHTSVAIHDALRMVTCPVIEVHLSNPHRRQSFRHHSYVSTAATGVICGLGATGYLLAIDAAASLLKTPR
jgi:3-dehydroquinate dehydratase II